LYKKDKRPAKRGKNVANYKWDSIDSSELAAREILCICLRIRNAEARGFDPLWSTDYSHHFKNLARHHKIGPTYQLANT
jgi:hypothetical protein